jgi:hypothetical protein
MATPYRLDISKQQAKQPLPTITARVGDWGYHSSIQFILEDGGVPIENVQASGLTFEGIAPGTFELSTPLYDNDGILEHHNVWWEIDELGRTGRRTPGDAYHDSSELVAIELFGEGNFEVSQESKMTKVQEPRYIFDNTGFSGFDAESGSFTYNFPQQVFAVAGSFSQAYFSYTTTDGRASTANFNISISQNVDFQTTQTSGYISEYQKIIDDTYALQNLISTTIADSMDAETIAQLMLIPEQLEDIMGQVNELAAIIPSDFVTLDQAEDIVEQSLNEFFPSDVIDKISNGTMTFETNTKASFFVLQELISDTDSQLLQIENMPDIQAMPLFTNPAVYNFNDDAIAYTGNVPVTAFTYMIDDVTQNSAGVQVNVSGKYRITATCGLEGGTQGATPLDVGFDIVLIRPGTPQAIFYHPIGEVELKNTNSAAFPSTIQAHGSAIVDAQPGDIFTLIKRGSVSNGTLNTYSFIIEQI